MGFYKSIEHMFLERHAKALKKANAYWAIAKNGGDGSYYAKAKEWYEEAKRLKECAEKEAEKEAKKSSGSFTSLS